MYSSFNDQHWGVEVLEMCFLSARSGLRIILVLFALGYVNMGKYKLRLVSLEKCKIQDSKMDKTVALTYYFASRKYNRTTTLIKTNFTNEAKTGPWMVTFRGYQVKQNSAKDLIFKLENISCKSPLTFQFIDVMKLKLDKDCYAPPGTYTADNINIEDFTWLFTKAMAGVGKYAYDLEFATPRGVGVCITLMCDIYEVKQSLN